MKNLFTQTAALRINNAVCAEFLKKLPEVICKHTDWDYAYQQRNTGCFLKPTFHNMPYRTSFVPEMDVVVSYNEGYTMLHMRGEPVKFVRVFMALWLGVLLLVEMFLMIAAITSRLDSLFPVFIVAAMCIFGYLLCKLATKATFHSVVKAIQKEYGVNTE